jgi:membrane fusion protein, multidrug efflux system
MTLSAHRACRAIFLCGQFLLLSFVIGCNRTPTPTVEEETPSAPVVAVAPQIVILGEKTELVGSTLPLPNQAARITALVEGRVLWVLGDGENPALVEGQRVPKGQVIVQLDDRAAQAKLQKLLAQRDEMDEQKKQAELAEKLALLDVDRLEKLRPQGMPDDALPLVSRIELEKARIALQDAQSKQKGVAAKQRGAQAEAQSVALELEYHKLRAPIAGVLGTVQAAPGQTLAIGAAVADVINLDEIDVLCAVPPRFAARLALDQPAFIATQNHHELTGKVAFIAVQAQPETGNFFVKARFPNREAKLRANGVVRVHVLTQPESKRLTIPEAALYEDQVPPTVIVADDVEIKKNAEGKEEKFAKARKLHAVIGVRDREHRVVEIIRLEDPEKKERVAAENQLFVIEGGHGLHNDDVLRLEEPHGEEKK